jgi:hypothetical protein
MKRLLLYLLFVICFSSFSNVVAQQRRPIDNEHPMWMIHVDVWNSADPQKIIDLIPEDIRPFVCMNLSLSCQYDKEKNIYKMPRSAVRTYKSWGSVCQQNGLWFTCQPASGGHTHIQDDDLATFEYFFKRYPNFLGWNYAEQFWGFDEAGDKSSSTQSTRWALFAKLVEMSHRYGGFLTVSFCGNIWSHPLNPVGQMKREPKLLEACRKYPEAILWLYKYTTSTCFYNNESVTFSPFISGLAKNYGVRYDNCGWNGAMEAVVGKDKCKYPVAAGIGTVMEQTGINGGAVWDGPELIWTEDFQNLSESDVDGYKRRNWGTYPGFRNIWIDMFRKVIDGTLHIPSRQEVVDRTKIVVVNDINTGDNDENKYAAWGNLYDRLYKQDDPANKGNGQMDNNLCYFKKTGRYATIPVCIELYDDLAKSIPVQVLKSKRSQRWNTLQKKVDEFNEQYPEVSVGNLFVARMGNQLVTYTPYTYLNKNTAAEGRIPLIYNTCDSLILNYGKLSSGLVREYNDHIDLYLNNYRTDTTTMVKDIITIKGATSEPTYVATKRCEATGSVKSEWNGETGSFTLSVTHKGPYDISIQCSGANDRGSQPAVARSLGIPQQPAANTLPIIIEAEDMDTKNVSGITITNSGWYVPDMQEFAGNGYVTMGASKSGSLRHQLKLQQSGDYTITVRYCQSTKAGQMKAVVNGESTTFDIVKTAKNDWQKATFTAHLNEGVNDLRLNNTEGINMIVDQIIYTPANAEPEKFIVEIRDSELGTVSSDISEAAEGETVTLTVQPNEGCQLKELRVINGVYYTMEKTISVTPGADQITFQMPDDNVVLQPVFVDATVAYQLDFADVLAGAMPQGWRCIQENSDVHEYPNTYNQGARTFNGFKGYQGKALYWREQKAEYGRQTARRLTLQPGDYKLSYAMAAWKGSPQYKVSILNAAGSSIASSEVFTAAPNANGNGAANLANAERRELPFTVAEAGNYIVSFTNETGSTGGLREFLLLECRINTTSTSGIAPVLHFAPADDVYYDLQGRKVTNPQHGIYIKNGRKIFVK